MDLPTLDERVIDGPIPKPEPHKRTKARKDRQAGDRRSQIRAYVFDREQDICRCCRLRAAKSMHELHSRGAGGKVSKTNSIAVCGALVGTEVCCHTFLQAKDISVTYGLMGAEDVIYFAPRTHAAAEWLKLPIYQVLESPPTPRIRGES